ncbi:hypothetical protein [Mesorhizobium sp. M8A.F.Ca.ET.057.01.1.1]|uniref:hypothetical protein n=1 Tax=Mesorhizobium sp. M8A.F.Ca.ET.057.01.1.1 TaxID=2493679 RepID=UPI001FE191F9|nr:hypothetical protein [Mesorhizobium sp. M8A.F.Ca.ET.057.01.1.1]
MNWFGAGAVRIFQRLWRHRHSRASSLCQQSAQILQQPSRFQCPVPEASPGDIGKPLSDDVFALLPKLRLAARLLLGDVNASDRLVEKTLERALHDIDRRQAGLSTEDWLNRIMRNVVKSSGAGLLH